MSGEWTRNQVEITAFPHRYEIQARFSDLDPNHHVNNIAIAEMFSEGRSAFIRHMFSRIERPLGFHFVVGQVAVRYLNEARWPNMFTIGTGVLDIGAKSMRLGQAFFMEGACHVIAEAVLVAVQNSATVLLNDAVRAHLEESRLGRQLLPRQLM
ncbi:(3S)-malyl-CoA thioesterase [Sphingobium faniae]|nr:(3S)-malyl-CoA thioesterase [Sphingobium faniae]